MLRPESRIRPQDNFSQSWSDELAKPRGFDRRDEPVIQRLMDWFQRGEQTVVVAGPSGSGKSVLAFQLREHWRAQCGPAVLLHASDFIHYTRGNPLEAAKDHRNGFFNDRCSRLKELHLANGDSGNVPGSSVLIIVDECDCRSLSSPENVPARRLLEHQGKLGYRFLLLAHSEEGNERPYALHSNLSVWATAPNTNGAANLHIPVVLFPHSSSSPLYGSADRQLRCLSQWKR
jgi:hypothetical protein